MDKPIKTEQNTPRKPGEPYIEIDSKGIMWEFIDLGPLQPCVLGMTDEEFEQHLKNKNE